ncbi:multifunctional procollagen lysine hydroxylase and glycosyltransferase LH3-like [Cuculus canorus]|uniref:multifunctional procollagen lysine hydroxylase and glycosyltransferase LH3-like n=1 Tax=Cuculus canorus TaxID=55661 RepID=UPI0023AB3924|nr:multifunctional procollagen lysine hydroxylase and glycosyltransferase LH3-like [Cuculus canorus]
MAPLPLLLLLLLLGLLPPRPALRPEQLRVLTVATEPTEGYERFLRSARRFNYTVQTLGLGQRWRGGDVAHTVGGGQKVRWLKEALGGLRGDPHLVLLFVDSYDVIFAGGPQELLAKFEAGGARVLFSAEAFCWPDGGLAGAYPPPAAGGKAFLNSGGFMGFAPDIWRLVERWRFRDDDDDQLFYTRLYLDPQLREELGMALDHHSRIFQNLNGAIDEVVLKFEPGRVRVRNVAYDSLPVIIHGNGPTKLHLNYLGNYVPGGWNEGGCDDCDVDLRPLDGVPDEELPWVLVGVFVEQPTPFLSRFLQRLLTLRYPRARLGLFLHNREVIHEPHIAALWPQLRSCFASARLVGPEEALEPAAARDMGMELCRRDPHCEHYLSLDADVVLTHNDTLRALLTQNRRVLAPLLSRPGRLWSNFWGALSPDGFYARSPDYVDIVQGRRRAVWNVPHVAGAYLVGGGALRGPFGAGRVFAPPPPDPDLALCQRAREQGLFLHVTNRQDFGRLLHPGGFNASLRHPDVAQLPHNPLDWEEQYLHENYSRIFEENLIQEPCPDVFLFPLFSELFAHHILEEALGYGRWSSDHHEGGAEAVALGSLGLEPSWLGALRQFLPPIARRLFPGYHCKGRAVLSAVVRYRPSPPARPRTDPPLPPPATISLSVGLGPARGGGWLFPRYGCRASAPGPGWALLHPGRLTHRTETEPPRGDVRYSLLTLLDP